MATIYLVEFDIGYRGRTMQELLDIWLAEAKVAAATKLDVRQLWKFTGERKVILIVNISADGLDKMLMQVPLMKGLGDEIQLKVTALRPYEYFANDVNSMVSIDKTFDIKTPVKKDGGLFYWLQLDVEYHGVELNDFYGVFSEEVVSAMKAKEKGIVVDIWKAVGMRRIFVLMRVDTPDMLDQITFSLPIMKKMGDNVKIEVKSLRNYQSFGKDLATWCKK